MNSTTSLLTRLGRSSFKSVPSSSSLLGRRGFKATLPMKSSYQSVVDKSVKEDFISVWSKSYCPCTCVLCHSSGGLVLTSDRLGFVSSLALRMLSSLSSSQVDPGGARAAKGKAAQGVRVRLLPFLALLDPCRLYLLAHCDSLVLHLEPRLNEMDDGMEMQDYLEEISGQRVRPGVCFRFAKVLLSTYMLTDRILDFFLLSLYSMFSTESNVYPPFSPIHFFPSSLQLATPRHRRCQYASFPRISSYRLARHPSSVCPRYRLVTFPQSAFLNSSLSPDLKLPSLHPSFRRSCTIPNAS
jgi:hypothetical protein